MAPFPRIQNLAVGGLACKWNEEHPKERMRPGDSIVKAIFFLCEEVNGSDPSWREWTTMYIYVLCSCQMIRGYWLETTKNLTNAARWTTRRVWLVSRKWWIPTFQCGFPGIQFDSRCASRSYHFISTDWPLEWESFPAHVTRHYQTLLPDSVPHRGMGHKSRCRWSCHRCAAPSFWLQQGLEHPACTSEPISWWSSVSIGFVSWIRGRTSLKIHELFVDEKRWKQSQAMEQLNLF